MAAATLFAIIGPRSEADWAVTGGKAEDDDDDDSKKIRIREKKNN